MFYRFATKKKAISRLEHLTYLQEKARKSNDDNNMSGDVMCDGILFMKI